MNLREVTQPTVEPVSLDEAKLFLRESQDEQDEVIQLLLTAARQYAENYTRRCFVQRSLELSLEAFPCNSIIELPRPPLVSVQSVTYIDTAGVEQTVDAADYQIDSVRAPGLLKPAYGKYWQATRDDFNAVKVLYTAGYSAVGSPSDYTVNIPAAIKQWIKVRVAQLYEHREAIIAGTIIAEIPRSYVDGMLDPFIVRLFG